MIRCSSFLAAIRMVTVGKFPEGRDGVAGWDLEIAPNPFKSWPLRKAYAMFAIPKNAKTGENNIGFAIRSRERSVSVGKNAEVRRVLPALDRTSA